MFGQMIKSGLMIGCALVTGVVIGALIGENNAREEMWNQIIEKAESVKVVEV